MSPGPTQRTAPTLLTACLLFLAGCAEEKEPAPVPPPPTLPLLQDLAVCRSLYPDNATVDCHKTESVLSAWSPGRTFFCLAQGGEGAIQLSVWSDLRGRVAVTFHTDTAAKLGGSATLETAGKTEQILYHGNSFTGGIPFSPGAGETGTVKVDMDFFTANGSRPILRTDAMVLNITKYQEQAWYDVAFKELNQTYFFGNLAQPVVQIVGSDFSLNTTFVRKSFTVPYDNADVVENPQPQACGTVRQRTV